MFRYALAASAVVGRWNKVASTRATCHRRFRRVCSHRPKIFYRYLYSYPGPYESRRSSSIWMNARLADRGGKFNISGRRRSAREFVHLPESGLGAIYPFFVGEDIVVITSPGAQVCSGCCHQQPALAPGQEMLGNDFPRELPRAWFFCRVGCQLQYGTSASLAGLLYSLLLGRHCCHIDALA